jgi:hypothetical protein
MVGDSQIESLQVEPGQAMFSVAEEQMVNSGRPAEWYGFGNSGWGTAQHIEVIRHYVLDYHPDAVILLFVQNDPFDCSPYLVDIEPHVPRYSLDDSGELILRPPSWWEPSGKSRLAVHSALFRYFIVQKHVHLRHGGQVRDIGGLPLRDTSALQGGELDELSRLTMREREEKTWQLIEAMFRLARDECHSRGAILAIAFRGWHDEIDAPIGAKMPPVPPREEDPWCLGSRRCEMGREQVGPIAERLGIPYLDLTAALCDEVAKSGRSHRFPDDNHFNAMAHRAAGAALAKWVHRIVLAGNFTSPSPRTDQ